MILPKSFFDTTVYFGISIGNSSVKAVSIDAQGKTLAYSQSPLQSTDLNMGSHYETQLITALKNIKDQGAYKTPYVAVVIPENQAFSKQFSLSGVTLTEFQEAVQWQFNDIFPFPAEEVYSDWKILRQDKGVVEALVVAVNRKKIDFLRKCLAAVGLYPISFETSVSALSKITQLTEKKLSILIDVNVTENSVSFIESGVPLLTTTSLAVNQNQSLVESLETSIKTLINYYQEKRNVAADGVAIAITGDSANANLAETLQSKIRQPVTLIVVDQITPGFHQAYAAAVSHIELPESPQSINLLPEDLRNWYQEHYVGMLKKKTLKIQAGALIVGGMLTLGNMWHLKTISNQLGNTPTTSVQNQDKLDYNPGEIVKKASRINTLFTEKVGPQEEFAELLSLVPPTVKIENIAYEETKKTFEITGTTPERAVLIEFKEKLEKSPYFTKVSLPIGSLTQQENSSFSIKCSIKETK